MSAEPKLTLAHKKNLKDNEANKTALLAKLKDITGFEYTFEVTPSWEEVVPMLHKAGIYPRDHEKLGDTFYGPKGYLHFVVEKFELACKDEMIKEALLDATPARKILFTIRPVDTQAPKMAFTDGIFHVGVPADRFSHGGALHICEGDITKLL